MEVIKFYQSSILRLETRQDQTHEKYNMTNFILYTMYGYLKIFENKRESSQFENYSRSVYWQNQFINLAIL